MKCLGFDNVWIHVSFGENVAWIDYKHACPYMAPATTPVFPRLEDQADKEKASQRLPKDSGLWQGRAGELCPAQLKRLCPWEGSPCTHPGEAPQPRSRLVPSPGAAGMAQGLQDTVQLCPARLQKAVSAQWVGFKEAREPVPVGNSTVPSETLDMYFVLWLSTQLGWGRWHSCAPSPCQSCTALWGTGQGRGSAGQGPELSRDPGSTWSCHTHIDRADHLSPCNC